MNAVQADAATADQGNPGQVLRRVREEKGWSVAEVAGQLNLTGQCLRQLESGDFDKLPGHTFTRGYLRAYARLLGLDPDAIVRSFDQLTGTRASESRVHGLKGIEQPRRLSQSLLRLVSFILLAGLAGAGFLWWQEQSQGRDHERSGVSLEHVEVESADGSTQIHPLDEPEDQALQEDQVDEEQAPAEVSPEVAAQPEAPLDTPQSPAAVPAPAEVPSAPAPAAAAPVATPGETPAVVAGAGEGVLRIAFSADCWIQIKNAEGKILASGLKRAGESVELAGKVPMEVRLGFARGAQVSYNGQAVDVAPFTSGETARLQVGQ